MLFDDDTLHSISQSLWFERLKIMLCLASQSPTTFNSLNSDVFLEELRISISSLQLFTIFSILYPQKSTLQILCHSDNDYAISITAVSPTSSNRELCNLNNLTLITTIVHKDSWRNTLNDDYSDAIIL